MTYDEIQELLNHATASNDCGELDEAERMALEVITQTEVHDISGSEQAESEYLELRNRHQLRLSGFYILGSIAHTRGNYSLAISNFESSQREAGLCNDQEAVVAALNRKGAALQTIGSHELALDCFNTAWELSEKLGLDAWVARIMSNIGLVYWSLSIYDKALEFCQNAHAKSDDLGDKEVIANTTSTIGNIYWGISDYQNAKEYHQKARTLFEEIGHKAGLARSLENIGVICWELEDYINSLEYSGKALIINEELGDKIGIANNLVNIGISHQKLSDYPRALECYQKGLSINEELGSKVGVALCKLNLGWAYNKPEYNGYNVATAEGFLFDAMQTFEQTGSKRYLYDCHLYLAEMYRHEKRWEEAHTHFERYHQIKSDIESVQARKKAEQMEMQNKIAEKDHQRKLEKLEMELEMKQTQDELSNRALQLVQQTEMIQNFRTELEGIVHEAETAEKAVRNIKKKLKELPANVLNWQKFEGDFQKVHPKFQMNLRSRFPELTVMEQKICCLLRIGMHTPSIATLLFVSERTIENHRYNIRKKLHIKIGEDVLVVLSAL